MKYPTQSELDARKRDAEFASAKERGLQQIYHAYPMIPRADANDTGIEELCAEFYGHGTLGYPAPDLPTFRSIVEADPQILKGTSRLYIEPVERQQITVIDEICELLRSPDGTGKGGRYSEAALNNERKRLQMLSKEQLITRRNEVLEKQRLAGMSVGAIRQELAANRPPQQAKALPPEVTKASMHALPSHEIRKLIRQYGASTVNDRIFGRS